MKRGAHVETMKNKSGLNTYTKLGKGEVESSILSGSTTNAHEIGLSGHVENLHRATHDGTEREDHASTRGISVDFVHLAVPREVGGCKLINGLRWQPPASGNTESKGQFGALATLIGGAR